MSKPAAQAAPGHADDGFTRRLEREAQRLRQLTLALEGTRASHFWARGVKVSLAMEHQDALKAEEAGGASSGDGGRQVSAKRRKARERRRERRREERARASETDPALGPSTDARSAAQRTQLAQQQPSQQRLEQRADQEQPIQHQQEQQQAGGAADEGTGAAPTAQAQSPAADTTQAQHPWVQSAQAQQHSADPQIPALPPLSYDDLVAAQRAGDERYFRALESKGYRAPLTQYVPGYQGLAQELVWMEQDSRPKAARSPAAAGSPAGEPKAKRSIRLHQDQSSKTQSQ